MGRIVAILALCAPTLVAAQLSCGDTRLVPIAAYDASIGDAPPVEAPAIDRTDVANESPMDAPPMDVPSIDLPPADVPPVDVPPVDVPPIPCPTALVGFAAETGGTRGGQGGMVVTAATPEELAMYAMMDVPLVIQIATKISLTEPVRPHSDKTIEGVRQGAEVTGNGFYVKDAHNVIIRRLTISKALKADAIGIDNSNHVWVDHCDLSSDRLLPETSETYDGLVDITHASDNVTVSWNIFHDHYRASIVGHTSSASAIAEDTGHLTVTYHHNVFTRVSSNTPRVRFGRVHAFNNWYDDVMGEAAIISQMGASVLVQGNVFRDVILPITTVYGDPMQGGALAVANLCLANCGDYNIQTPTTWMPTYAFTPESADSLPVLLTECAGPKL